MTIPKRSLMFTELSLKQPALSESVLDSKLWNLSPSRIKDRHNCSAADIAVVIKPVTRTWSKHAAEICNVQTVVCEPDGKRQS
jgi:hypothetical protein